MRAWRADNVPQEGENGCSRVGMGLGEQTVADSRDESALKAAQLPKSAKNGQKQEKSASERDTCGFARA